MEASVSMSKKIRTASFLLLLGAAGVWPAAASDGRLAFELQGIAGYSSLAKKTVFYSHEQMLAMQKPGLGLDLVQRFGGAVVAFQARLAWNAEGEPKTETQIYDAYLKIRTGAIHLWAGHNKPAFGLAHGLDSRSLLLQPLTRYGFGFERDWGFGAERQTAKGGWGLSATSGSGMALRFDGSHFLAGRYGYGRPDQDGYTAGFSVGYGRFQDVAGIHKLSDTVIHFVAAALDFTVLKGGWEHRFELILGELDQAGAFAGLYRLGLPLSGNGKWKLELQPAAMLFRQATRFEFSAGASLQAHPDWTFRAMTAYDTQTKSFRAVVQVYFLKGFGF
jgi:hypothetical protein